MEHKYILMLGFFSGTAIFLMLFKVFILDFIPPSDELAPGIVVFIAALNGILFAFAGSSLKKYLLKKSFDKKRPSQTNFK